MQLSNFSTELLLKLMSYLPTRDKVTMRYVSRRFRDVSKIPSLWKEFLWLDYQPRHVCSVSSILKMSGEHVRRVFFPGHVTQTKILEMLCYCTKVTHLCLTENFQLSLDHMREIVHTMTHLHQLEVFTDGNHVHTYPPGVNWGTMRSGLQYDFIEGLLKIAAASSVRKLNLHTHTGIRDVLTVVEDWVSEGYPLLGVAINIYLKDFHFEGYSIFQLLTFWSSVSSFNLPSFEISMYNNKRIPMNLYPAVPLRKFQFGPSATPPFIRLSNHNIMGLENDIFHIRWYDHRGMIIVVRSDVP